MPVASLFKFLFDDISNEKDLASSKQVGDDKGSQRRDKYHCDSADDSRNSQWKDDLEKSLSAVCTEISCGIDDVFVDLYQYIVDRQYHKRQEVIDHSKDDRVRCVDDRKFRQMEKG